MNKSEQQISFHDSSIIAISRDRDVLDLLLEDVSVGQVQKPMKVKITGIESVTRDDLPLAALKMETDDGEILRLSSENKIITLVVIWHQYSPHLQDTHVYQLFGKKIKLNHGVRENS